MEQLWRHLTAPTLIARVQLWGQQERAAPIRLSKDFRLNLGGTHIASFHKVRTQQPEPSTSLALNCRGVFWESGRKGEVIMTALGLRLLAHF